MFWSQRRNGERGQILPLIGVGIVAILGVLALAVDSGYWRYQQRLEQSAADSAAVAAAIKLNYPTTSSTASPTQIGQASASVNGFTDDSGTGNTVVTVKVPPDPNTPPHTGATPYPANTAVEVDVQKKQPLFFSGLFGNHFGSGYARAVAVSQPDNNGACLWQLSLSGTGLRVTGSKPLTTVNCGVLANGVINVPSYYETSSVGYWAANNPNGVGFSGAVQLPAPVNDPCVRIAGCEYLATTAIPPQSSSDIDGKTVSSMSVPAGATYAVVDNCCSKGTVTIGPGLYYFYGGISGTLEGDGVTVVNVNGSFTASGLGAAHPYFSAPTTGNSAGVAFYQPLTNASMVTLNGGGNGTSYWDGLFYAGNAMSVFTTNGGSVTVAFLVVGGVRLNGGGSGNGLTVDPTLGGLVSLMKQAEPTHVVLSE